MARLGSSANDKWLFLASEAELVSSPAAVRLQLGWQIKWELDLMERRRKAKETDDGPCCIQ